MPRAAASGQAVTSCSVRTQTGNLFIPRVLEYRLANSQALRAYFDAACNRQCLMNIGVKHSLCLISIESNTQPSESSPTK